MSCWEGAGVPRPFERARGEEVAITRILDLAVSSRRYEQEEEARDLLLEHSNCMQG